MAYSYKTAITFGLVYIPVELHAIIKNNDIGFNMIHKKTKERIKYQKTCENCNGNVGTQDIIKGYEYDDDKYVTFTNEEFNKLKTKKDKTIAITQFSDLNEIDPLYYDKSFYVVPTNAPDAYSLIAEAMQKQKKVALAKTILGNKEVIISVRSDNGILILSTMFFYEEVQKQPYKIEKTKSGSKEIEIASAIIKAMDKSFKPQEFIDEFKIRVEKAIEQKINGKEIEKIKDVKAPNKVINLMDALNKSLKSVQKSDKKSGKIIVMQPKKSKAKVRA